MQTTGSDGKSCVTYFDIYFFDFELVGTFFTFTIMRSSILIAGCFAALASAQAVYPANNSTVNLRRDNGTYGPAVEEVHYCKLPWLHEDFSDPVQTMISGP